VLAAILCLAAPLAAQVPQMLNYQGRVVVRGVNFDGRGQFKFALVDGESRTFWSNDGTSTDGHEPETAVRLPVINGLYSVLLGDDRHLDNMTPIPTAVFQNPDVRLRVWFDDGENGSQQLAPDQRIAAVGYAMMADNVPDGAITSSKLATGAAAANLATGGQVPVPRGGMILSASATTAASLTSAGYVRIGLVDTGELWQARSGGQAPYPRYNHTAVWTGSDMIIWGGQYTELLSGVLYDTLRGDGGRYNPAAKAWTAVATANAPAARTSHNAVWTGTNMIVWGGLDGDNHKLNDGGRYNPTTDTWLPITTTGAPSARDWHTVVWTGSEMIVWGGSASMSGSSFNDGGRYNPTTDTWTPVSTAGAPAARKWHTAVWTGSEMIVWGGGGVTGFDHGFSNDGGRYNPTTDTWTPVSTAGAPTARWLHTAVWTGSEMVICFGTGNGSSSTVNLYPSGRYNPAADAWTAGSTTEPQIGIASGSGTKVVWTGSAMVYWGGSGMRLGSSLTYGRNTGGRYDPVLNSWKDLSTNPPVPPGRYGHTAVWTGSEMLVFGGADDFSVYPSVFNDLWSLSPGRTMTLYQNP
jgi:N-acetylneuraminic acid mutarotase